MLDFLITKTNWKAPFTLDGHRWQPNRILHRLKWLVIIALLVVGDYSTISIRLLPSKNHESCQRVCNICNLNFKRISEYEKHIAGRAHQSMVKRNNITVDEIYKEFQNSAPNWFSTETQANDLIDLWNYDELSSIGLKFRETCLHPTPTIKNLNPYQKTRVWRYIRDVMGVGYYSELASILAAVDNDEFGHIRIKELFESLESYKVISNFVIAASKTSKAPPQSIVELACGHGLVGCLLAYRFPKLKVHLYDLHKRPTFDSFLRAFEAKGFCRPGATSVLPNIQFHEADMVEAAELIEDSIVVCLHGCNEVNSLAIEMAIQRKSSWIVMPCCIRREQYLGSSCQVLIDDDQIRFSLLVGALASTYDAQEIRNIDKRITNRNLLVAGGVYDKTKDDEDVHDNTVDDNNKAFKRKRMPKLILS